MLEELLIDFWELLGEHSSENMAEVVWTTSKLYRIENQIISILLHNFREASG